MKYNYIKKKFLAANIRINWPFYCPIGGTFIYIRIAIILIQTYGIRVKYAKIKSGPGCRG